MPKINSKPAASENLVILAYGFVTTVRSIEEYLIQQDYMNVPIRSIKFDERFKNIKEVFDNFGLTAFAINDNELAITLQNHHEIKFPDGKNTVAYYDMKSIIPSIEEYTLLKCAHLHISMELEKLTKREKLELETHSNNIDVIMIINPWFI